jgi:signal peptidase I
MLQRVDSALSRRSLIGIAAVVIAVAMPFRLVAITPSPDPAKARVAMSAPAPIAASRDDLVAVAVPAAAAAQADAAGAERKAFEQQRRKLEEARKVLEDRETELHETLRQSRAEIERARAELAEAQRNVNEQVYAIALEVVARRRDALQLQDAAEQTARLERLVRAHRELLRQQQERADSEKFAAAAMRAQPETLSRGDLVVLTADADGMRPPDSRVVAVAGDGLRVSNGGIVVNGEPVSGFSPEFLAGLPDDPWEETVPPGHYFVAADQRTATGASRFWGLIPAERIARKQ